MAVWKWRTDGVPASSAFLPRITKSAVSWLGYKYAVVRDDGARPAPPHDLPHDPLAPSTGAAYEQAVGGRWFPVTYYTPGLPSSHGVAFPAGGNDCGVAIYSDNQLPIPAVNPVTGTRRYGGGQPVQPYMDPYRRAQTRRTIAKRHA